MENVEDNEQQTAPDDRPRITLHSLEDLVDHIAQVRQRMMAAVPRVEALGRGDIREILSGEMRNLASSKDGDRLVSAAQNVVNVPRVGSRGDASMRFEREVQHPSGSKFLINIDVEFHVSWRLIDDE